MAANPNEPPRHFYSLDEYFALEHAGDAQYEYWDGDIVCMSGGSRAHGLIADNVYFRIREKLHRGTCRAFTSDTAVKTPTLLPYRYPDVTVACGNREYQNIRGVDALLNPVLIVEVLSPTTEHHDREEKFVAYQVIESFRQYLLIAQNEPRVKCYLRQADRRWSYEEVTGLDAELILDSIGCTLPLREIYEEVELPGN
jgi:Uma2 family endonuclease